MPGWTVSGGELADRVARDTGDGGALHATEEGTGGEDAGCDDEGLGHGRVADRVGVRRGAVGDEIDAGRVGERRQQVALVGIGQPGFEESRSLGALTGRYDNDHWSIMPTSRGSAV
jgi:hypothetical protein